MTEPYDATIIIPTLKEEQTIKEIIERIETVLHKNQINGQILIVDSHSPDKTADVVRGLQHALPNLTIFIRDVDRGLSAAVVTGFEQAQSDVFLVTDADGSHDIEQIPKMLQEIRNGNDIVIGSRYMKEGGIKSWPLKRRIISIGATALGRILVPKIKDPVSGFFAVRKSVVQNVQLKPKGYKILLEILGKGKWNKAVEVPYVFVNRQTGSSKLRPKIMMEYAIQVLDNGWYTITHRTGKIWEEWWRDAKYIFVGLSGVVVNEGLLILLVSLGLIVPIASILAIEASRLSNFILNDIWTFKEGQNVLSWWKRLIAHQGVTITGAIVNWLVLTGLVVLFSVNYKYANLLAILIAFAWNFTGSKKVTWQKKS
jgi:dolichol-phosphate mannosyltransferase